MNYNIIKQFIKNYKIKREKAKIYNNYLKIHADPKSTSEEKSNSSEKAWGSLQIGGDSQEEFKKAIQNGLLTRDENKSNYVGNYMYMGQDLKNKPMFKHGDTREYL
jgi:hypothetical protein